MMVIRPRKKTLQLLCFILSFVVSLIGLSIVYSRLDSQKTKMATQKHIPHPKGRHKPTFRPEEAEKDWRNFPFLPSNNTRSVFQLIQGNRATTLISPEVCDSKNEREIPKFLIVVMSAVENFEARYSIRTSWAEDQDLLGGGAKISVLFMLGKPEDPSEKLLDNLKKEANVYKDIIQEDFLDTYYNLTVKSLMMMKWVAQNCINNDETGNSFDFLLKTDDDVYVNIPNLINAAYKEQAKHNDLLMGNLFCNSPVIRNTTHKWYVPKSVFDEPKWPDFLSGTAYLMHRNTVLKLLSTALEEPIIHLEDVFLTGIVARKAGIGRVDNFGMSYKPRKLDPCLFAQTITTHKVPTYAMAKMKVLLDQAKGCKKLSQWDLRKHFPQNCTSIDG